MFRILHIRRYLCKGPQWYAKEWDLDLSVTLGGALLAGLLSFASPCVLPLVPPYLAFLAGSSLSDLSGSEDGATVDPTAQRRAVISAIAFTLGFATVFTVMGASASAIGMPYPSAKLGINSARAPTRRAASSSSELLLISST